MVESCAQVDKEGLHQRAKKSKLITFQRKQHSLFKIDHIRLTEQLNICHSNVQSFLCNFKPNRTRYTYTPLASQMCARILDHKFDNSGREHIIAKDSLNVKEIEVLKEFSIECHTEVCGIDLKVNEIMIFLIMDQPAETSKLEDR